MKNHKTKKEQTHQHRSLEEFSRMYASAISGNVKRAFAEKRSKGEAVGPLPLGYMQKDGSRVTLDALRAPLIKQLFEIYSHGDTSISDLQAIAAGIGLRDRKQGILSKTVVKSILSNPFYMGIARSKKYDNYPHKYPKLIAQDCFGTCQELLQKHSQARKGV